MQQISIIKQKLQQLIKQQQLLQKENLQLKQNVSENLNTISLQSQAIKELQKKFDISQINQSSLNKEDKAMLEKRINSYLKDIDNCLSLINKD